MPSFSIRGFQRARQGDSNAEIGAILGISSATVSKHLEHIYPKLGVENRTAAASFASEVSRNTP
ncbi:MAG: hypothetical protein DMF76_10835 [Acidobacteria bacterium]|nr:MAG: hypothetical protein DMF76_10835 [Acidobacteriota bacterium]